MLDAPKGMDILREVQAALKAGIAPGFQQAVAANAVALALREAELAADAQSAELARLESLLGRAGNLAELNRALAEGIRSGALAGPALTGHLIRTTIEKMQVDQPNYPAFRVWQGEAK